MNDHVLASVARKAFVFPKSEAAVVHIIDDDESVRAALDGLLRSVALTPAPHTSVSEFLAAKTPDVPAASSWMCACPESVVSTSRKNFADSASTSP
jgi:hypothetical protein